MSTKVLVLTEREEIELRAILFHYGRVFPNFRAGKVASEILEKLEAEYENERA